MKTELTVRKQISLNVPAGRVWEALTDPQQTEKYMFGCKVVTDWKVGSPLTWEGLSAEGKTMVFVKGEVVAVEEGKLLKFTTFDPNSDLEDTQKNHTTVTYQLSAQSGKTVLLVEQGDFAEVPDGKKRFEETKKGWDFAIAGLRDMLEKTERGEP